MKIQLRNVLPTQGGKSVPSLDKILDVSRMFKNCTEYFFKMAANILEFLAAGVLKKMKNKQVRELIGCNET